MCNIAATAASNGDGGCFRQADRWLIQPHIIEATWTGAPTGNFHISSDRFWNDEIGNAPLLQRGWVLQERVLTPRNLHFSSHQMFWECREHIACETYPNGLPLMPIDMVGHPTIDLKARLPVSPGDHCFSEPGDRLGVRFFWDMITMAYSRLALTKPEDKLVAVSGVAKHIQPFLGDRYLAGLWLGDLPLRLLWHVNSGTKSARPITYRAPSWSWASIDADIFPGPGRGIDVMATKLLEASTKTLSGNPTGQVVDGYLRLRGPLKRMNFRHRPYGPLSYRSFKVEINHQVITPYIYLDCESDTFDNLHLLVVLLGQNHGLLEGILLQPTGIVPGQFRRCGTMAVLDEEDYAVVVHEFEDPGLQFEEYYGAGNYIISII